MFPWFYRWVSLLKPSFDQISFNYRKFWKPISRVSCGKKIFFLSFFTSFVYIYTKEILRFSAVFFMKKKMLHCVKRVQIGSYFWFIFSCIQSEYRKIRTRNNCLFGDFPRSAPFYASWKSENIWFSYDFQKQSPGGILLLDFRAYKSQHWSEMD